MKTKEKNSPWVIGANYFIRTATFHHTGRLVNTTPTELILEDAAWIADSGRFMDALRSCEFSEVEPFPTGVQIIINRAALIDACQIKRLPTEQK